MLVTGGSIMKTNKSLVDVLKDGGKWLESQGGCPTRRDIVNRVENLLITSLIVLNSSDDWPRYRAWMQRRQLVRPFRDRATSFAVKKWNREFRRLIRLAISDLEALPTRVVTGVPLGRDVSAGRLRQLARARSKKQSSERNGKPAVQRGRYSESPVSVALSQTP